MPTTSSQVALPGFITFLPSLREILLLPNRDLTQVAAAQGSATDFTAAYRIYYMIAHPLGYNITKSFQLTVYNQRLQIVSSLPDIEMHVS